MQFTLKQKLIHFFKEYWDLSRPVLLAFSGGCDSMAIFHLLIEIQEMYPIPFGVAHVDHGWRLSSGEEAEFLRTLAAEKNISFYQKKLDPSTFVGNLEDMCRKERWQFFHEICQKHEYKGVVLGHHSNDQSETVLKRVFEGAFFSHLQGMNRVSQRDEIFMLRPFLDTSKKELMHYLVERSIPWIEDSTNNDPKYLRARMRKKMIPILEEIFGKEIDANLAYLSKQAEMLESYFSTQLSSLLNCLEIGALGSYLDASQISHRAEAQWLLKKIADKLAIHLSRETLDIASIALIASEVKELRGKGYIMHIDHKRVFVLPDKKLEYQVTSCTGPSNQTFGWKQLWQTGRLVIALPMNVTHRVGRSRDRVHGKQLNEIWSQNNIPQFLRRVCPVFLAEDKVIIDPLTALHQDELPNWVEIVLIT